MPVDPQDFLAAVRLMMPAAQRNGLPWDAEVLREMLKELANVPLDEQADYDKIAHRIFLKRMVRKS